MSLDGVDVGVTPLELERPAGSYQLLVRKRGFTAYQTQLTVGAGQEVNLRAPLLPEKRSVVTRWWFWTVLGGAATGVALGSYFLAQSPPAINGGTLGWAPASR